MTLEFYDPKQHLKLLEGWLDARGMDHSFAGSRPAIGFVAINRGTPVGACFLRRVEPDIGMIDGLITNPFVAPEIRNEANDALTREIVELCKTKNLGIVKLIAWSNDEHTLVRASKYAARPMVTTMLMLDIDKT